MGPPDGTKIALGLLASSSALLISYILLKKYGFRASRSKSVEGEHDQYQQCSYGDLSIPSTKTDEAGKDGEKLGPSPVTIQEKVKLSSGDVQEIGCVDNGQNQTSLSALGGDNNVVLPQDDNGVKKSDKSSDESSYDVIEDDRMRDAVEDDGEDDKEEHGEDENTSAKGPMEGECVGGQLEMESSLEASLVVVEADQSSVEKSGESFYTSADENFGMTHLEETPELAIQEEEEEDKGVMELSSTEDETTIMYKSASAGNDSLTLEGKDSTNDVTPDVDGAGEVGEKTVLADDVQPSHIDDPAVQEKLQTLAITDNVLRADLEAVPPAATAAPTQDTPTGALKEELDLTKVTEVLSKCQGSPMNVSKEDIHLLVELLRRNMPELQATVLNSIVRIAAFNQNTTNLRESGCPEEIVIYLKQMCESVIAGETGAETTLASINQVLTNLSMDPKAHPKLEDSIPTLINLLLSGSPSESLVLTIIRPLVNLSGEAPYHDHYIRAVPALLAQLDSGSHMTKVQSLKVLVNLSLDEKMVPYLLTAKAPVGLLDLLTSPTQNDVILRTVTMLANVFTAMKEDTFTPDSLPASKEVEFSESLYTALNDVDSVANLRSKVFRLTRHGDEDVCHQASRLYKHIPETAG